MIVLFSVVNSHLSLFLPFSMVSNNNTENRISVFFFSYTQAWQFIMLDFVIVFVINGEAYGWEKV